MLAPLLAFHTEIIVEYKDGAIRIDRNVHGLMHEEVVPRSLADNPEVIYVRHIRLTILQRKLKTRLRNASALVLVTGGLASAADPLWIEMVDATNVVAIDCERDYGVEGTS